MAIDFVRKNITDKFPELVITDSEILQMLPRFDSPEGAPDKSVASGSFKPADYQLDQLMRTAASLNCLRLLELGEAGYNEFVKSQDNYLKPHNTVLTKENFVRLAERFKGKDPIYMDALKVATIVQMVTLAPKVRDAADEAGVTYTVDSVEFLADCFNNTEKARKIFPLVENLYSQYQGEGQKQTLDDFLQNAFASKQHFRHMMYTECDARGYEALAAKIAQGEYATKDDPKFTFWADYWLINILGFRGQLDQKGSIYMTQNTYKAFEHVVGTIESGIAIANHSAKPFTAADFNTLYLCTLVEELGLTERQDLSLQEKHFVAHICAMMRLHDPSDAEIVVQSIKKMPEQAQQLIEDVGTPDEPTPTHLPALLDNLYDERHRHYASLQSTNSKLFEHAIPLVQANAKLLCHQMACSEAIGLGVQLHLLALKQYREKRGSSDVKPNVALSYRNLRGEHLLPLLENQLLLQDFKVEDHLSLDLGEECLVSVKPKLEAALGVGRESAPDVSGPAMVTQFDTQREGSATSKPAPEEGGTTRQTHRP